MFAFHLTVLEPRLQIERTRETDEGGQLEEGAPSASAKLPQLEGSLGLTWIQWLKEPLLYKVGSVGVFSNIAFRLVQCYLPLYLTETLKLRKESVAFFPLIIVITRVVVEMFCKRGIYKVKIRVIIVCTTAAIFGTSLWYYLHTEERTSLVYAPTVVFASMSSLLTMVTPTLHQELTGNEKENSSFVHGVFECSERAILGVIVFTIQMFYPDSTKSSSVGEFLRITFPAVLGTTIVIPLVVATAFMTSNDSHEVSSERSTPALDIEQGEGQRRTGRDYSELQGSSSTAAPSDAEQEGNHFHSQRDQVSASTAVPSDTPSEETQSHSEREQEIQEVKKALDELHRLPSTDL